MSWARRRQSLYLSIMGGVIALSVMGILLVLFSAQPTCLDGRQNQDERGIDCGGICAKMCRADVLAPSVLWSRALPLAPSLYHLVAYINNPNPTGAATSIPYSFKVFDDDNLLIAERRGVAFLLPGSVNPVFEPGIATGKRTPARTFFEFTGEGEWRTSLSIPASLSVEDTVLTEEPTPRVEARLLNQGQKSVNDIEVVAVLFDTEGNALSASRTSLPSVGRVSSAPLVFTWPERFPTAVARVEIIPRVRPID